MTDWEGKEIFGCISNPTVEKNFKFCSCLSCEHFTFQKLAFDLLINQRKTSYQQSSVLEKQSEKMLKKSKFSLKIK